MWPFFSLRGVYMEQEKIYSEFDYWIRPHDSVQRMNASVPFLFQEYFANIACPRVSEIEAPRIQTRYLACGTPGVWSWGSVRYLTGNYYRFVSYLVRSEQSANALLL